MAQGSIKRNYILNLIYQILTVLTPVVTVPYLSRVLGADGIGTYSFIDSVSSYFVLFATLGLTTFGQREISYVRDDRGRRSVVFWETVMIELFATLVCSVLYIVFSLTRDNWQLYIVLVFNIVAVTFNISWLFQGMEEFGKIVLRSAIVQATNISFVFLCVRSKDDLLCYLLGSSLIVLLGNVSYWISLGKYVDKPDVGALHPLRHVRTVLSLFIPTIAIQIYTVLDKTMIGVITGSAYENGYYEQALKISKFVLTLVTALGAAMIPRIGYYFERNETGKLRDYMYRGYRFVWFLGTPLCFGLMMVAGNFVPWFLGAGYEAVIPLMGISSFLILAIGINNVTGMQYLIPTKRQNIFTKTVIIGAVTNFILNAFLIRRYGGYGAAIASVAAEAVIAISQIYIVREELKPGIIIRSGINYFLSGAVMTVVLLLVRDSFTPSLINTLILILIGTGAYFAMLFILRDKFLLDNITSIYRNFRNKSKSKV